MPCFTDILEDLLFTVTDFLQRANVTHWVSYGSLLGIVRNNAMLPWTVDDDVVIAGMRLPLLY